MSTGSEEFGQVELVRHPLVEVRGLPRAQVGEVVQFSSGAQGQVFSLGAETVEIMVFAGQPLAVGETVTRTNRSVTISLSDALIGITLTALGEPISGSRTHKSSAEKERGNNLRNDAEGNVREDVQRDLRAPIDVSPKPLLERQRITELLDTGVSIVDLVLPLGKGQRELLIGDRKTGKTAFALQLAELQVQTGSLIVYAAIGKLQSEIKRLQQSFIDKKIDHAVTLIAASADDPPPVIYQAPFTAMAVAEYFTSLGHSVVLILDDLTTHAKYYREIALVGKRFPGRDSYPGDIFYTHARLLERAGCFMDTTKPGSSVSLTCLPIAETTDSELTDYIVSNLISITDGHLLFDTSLFSEGHRPAIHPGLSVTRVGKQTQSPLQRDMGHLLTSFINQYQKTVTLTHFGTELTDETKLILEKGESLFAFLNQNKNKVFSQAVMLVMSGVILNNWLVGCEPKEVIALRDLLQTQYEKNTKTHSLLDEVASADSLEIFLKNLDAKQKNISGLWQHSTT